MDAPATRALSLPQALVFRPTAEEFLEPLKYLASIRGKAEPYGIAKIIPPDGWAPPFAIDKGSFRFSSRIQAIHQLQDRLSLQAQQQFADDLQACMEREGKPFRKPPVIAGREVDLFKMYKAVTKRGGYAAVTEDKKWKDIVRILQVKAAFQGAPASYAAACRGQLGHVCLWLNCCCCTAVLQLPSSNNNASYSLRQTYQKCLLLYEEYEQEKLRREMDEAAGCSDDEQAAEQQAAPAPSDKRQRSPDEEEPAAKKQKRLKVSINSAAACCKLSSAIDQLHVSVLRRRMAWEHPAVQGHCSRPQDRFVCRKTSTCWCARPAREVTTRTRSSCVTDATVDFTCFASIHPWKPYQLANGSVPSACKLRVTPRHCAPGWI